MGKVLPRQREEKGRSPKMATHHLRKDLGGVERNPLGKVNRNKVPKRGKKR